MKKWVSALVIAVGCGALAAVTFDADARRFGGGRSFGVQRQAVPPRQTPAQPPASQQATPSQAAPAGTPGGATAAPATAPAGAAAASARAGTPAAQAGTAAAQPRTGMARWMGPIAGIAAGLGLAALLSHLGLSEAFASLLLVVLIVVAAVMLLRWLMRRSAGGPPTRYAGATGSGSLPLERRSTGLGAPGSAGPGTPSVAGGAQRLDSAFRTPASAPEGFDAASFLRHAKANFNRIQAAHDSGDLAAIRDVTTPQMYGEIEQEIRSRAKQLPTEVVRLDAQIVEVQTDADAHWVGVRFTGLLREDGAEMATPFDEVWNLTKPVDGSSGWLLAGIQQA